MVVDSYIPEGIYPPDLYYLYPWHERAACSGLTAYSGPNDTLFFPQRGQSTDRAKAICAGCEVKTECADYAIDMGIRPGIWGNMTLRQRQRVERARTTEVEPGSNGQL